MIRVHVASHTNDSNRAFHSYAAARRYANRMVAAGWIVVAITITQGA